MNNSALKQASFSNSREGNLTFFNESFFDPVKNRAETHKRSTYPISTQNLKSMKQNYNSTRNSSSSRRSLLIGSPAFYKSFMLTLAIFVAGVGSLWGQAVSTYTPLITSGTYTTITGTSILGNVDDGNSLATNIGFTFNLGGQNFTQFVANSNGHIRLGATAATSSYTPLSTTSNTYSISAAGRDGASTGGVIHTVTGSAPNRVSIIQYTGYRLVYNATTATVSFQIRLYETTNVVEIIYNGAVGNTTNRAAQVGIRGTTTAADTRNYSGTSSGWSALTAGNGSTTASWLSTSMPSNGRILRWSPPVVAACSGTPAPGNTITSSATVVPSGTVNLSLQNATSGSGVTYAWESGPSSTGPWTGFGTSSATQTTAAIFANTWFRCRVICGANTGASNPVQVTLGYCAASGTGASTSITNFVTTGGITNISNATGFSAGGYGNFTGLSCSQSAGQAIAFTLTYGSDPGISIFIDWNNDLDFADAGELALSSNAYLLGPATGTLTVPAGQAVGNYRMRVVIDWNAPTPIACPASINGEIEDYTFTVTCSPAQPSAITGTLNPEVGSSQTYSVTDVAGVTETWSFPSGWVITAGQGTNSVTVTVGGNNGTISVTPSVGACNGTARTATTTIPSYRWKYISSNLGSATWTGGEARNLSITIQNTGVATWNSVYANNIGVRWNSTTGSLSGAPWSDYFSRVTVGSLAPGATGTITLAIEAKNATAGPVYGANLADGSYYLAFDMVSETQCWFAQNSGTCGPGNTVFYSAVQTVSTVPTLSCTALTAFGNVCTNASATNSFSISGVNLTSNVTVGALTGYTYSTTVNGTYTSTLTLTPSGGSLNQTVFVKLTPTAATSYSGTIVVSSTGVTSQNVSASGTGIAGPTVNAGSDFNLCSGQVVPMNASTSATSSNGTASATYTAGNGSSLYNLTPTTATNSSCPIPLSVTIPAGAVITGVNVSYNMIAASGAYMSEQLSYLKCTSSGGVSEASMSVGSGALGGTMPYNRTNLTIANGVSGGGTINFQLHAFRTWGGAGCEAVYNYVNNNSFTITVNYSLNPTYSWTPATGLSATNILNPNCSTTSTTTYTLSVTGTNGCSASDQVVATVAGGSVPTTPTAAVSGASIVNVGGTAILTSTAGANTVWYTTASGGTSIGTGSPFTSPVQCATGSVTYYAEDNNGTCASNSRGAVSFTVRPMVASNPSNGLICSSGGSVTLSTQLTGASGITWSPNTNLSTTSGASTVASPTATTVYTMNATVAGCGSVSGTQTVGVIDAVAFTPTSTPASVCAGNTAALASNLASAGFTVQSITSSPSTPVSPTNLSNGGASPVVPLTSGTNDDGGWSSIPLNFSYNFFGTSYSTVNVGTNGVIQFGAYNANGGFTAPFGLGDYTFTNNFPTTLEPMNIIAGGACDLTITNGTVRYWTQGIAPTRVFVLDYNVLGLTSGANNFQIKLFETTGIVEIHVTSNTAQGGVNKVIGINNSDGTIGSTAYSSANNLTNTAWKFIPGANYTFQWTTAGSPIGGATSTTYTTPVLSTPGNVTYSVAATNPNTQCTTTQSVNITVNSLPAAPVSLGDVTACNTAGSQNLVVSTGAGETADWYNASTAGTLLTNNNTTYATATAGMYYAEAENTTTGCKSATRTAVTLNSNTAPSAPTASGAAYCQGATATALTASAPTGSNTQSWYTVAVGGTPLAGAPTPSTASAGTTNFYVSETSGSNGCESTRTLVGVTVNATPAAPSASNPSAYCQNATASALSATSDGSSTLYWYTVPTGGTGSTTAITPSTSAAGTATYYVSQLSASNCESSRTAITVTVNPTITASVTNSASSTSACGGGAITFTATPSNGGSPSYQWYLNGAAVSGEINPTYSLATPADADAIYVEMTPSAQTCLSSSAATASNTVTLTSTASTPTVSIQSTASSAFCPGTSVTFSVNSSANMGATPTYQWNLNGTPISGAINPSLVTTTLNNNDQVTLTMTSSLNGTCLTQSDATSTSVTSLVNSSTSITSQPADASACTGSSASFTVAGAGQGTLTYQWKKNGANITGNATATTSTLTISGIASGDAANYTVDVIGACGTATSNTAALALNAVTAISVQPVAVVACNGLTATYNVTASGQGTLSYQWRKDGSPISGATNSSYSIAGITSANAGNYSVVVSGGCGNVTSSNAALTVQPATLISSQPSASTICQNNAANFAVTATGQGALSYQWKLNGNSISGATGSTLAVSNAQAINAGSYTVDVTAGCGITSSNTALLTVNPATSITTQPVGTAGCEGQNTTFTVVAAGTGTLAYQWKYGSTNVGTNAASFNIPSTTTANDGNYSVVVTGGCGNTTSSTVALNVYPSPSSPAVISTADITDATLCGKNELTVAASTPGGLSTGEWSVVGNWGILPASNTDPNTTFTANNAALGGSPKQLVWSHILETSGNSCYSRDTITVEFKQPTITPIAGVIQNGDVVWGGLSSSDWSTSGNWYQYQSGALIRMTQGEPTASTKVYALSNSVGGTCVSSVNSPSLGASESAANMYVGVGAALNLSNGSMTIAGDLTNNGTINPGTGTVTFNGSSVQKITGSGTIANFNNVIVNKTGGTLTLEQPTKVSGTLTMTAGDLVTDDVNILEVGSSASAVGSVNWTAGTVRGPMKRWFAASTNATQASGVFPVGATIPGKGVINRYAQVNFASAPGTGGYIIAEYKTGTPSTGYTGLPLSYGVNQYIQNYEEEGYWDITPYDASGSAYAALNTAPYTLKLRMNNPSTLQPGLPPSGSNGNAVADISKIRIITSKGPSHNTWVLAGTQGSGHSVLASGDYLLEETGVTGFSFFNGGGNDNNPLPVELVSFSGLCEEGNINLTWQTASEFNSSHFDVEKSRDGENWQMLTTVPSAGTSNELLTYQTVDQNGTDGNNYYRLRQVDIDGTEKVYDPINVSCAEVTSGYFSSFPNPSGSSFQVIVNNKELIGTCVLNIVDATGKVIEQREIEMNDGINMFVINQELTPGIYFMNITNGSKSTSVLRHAVK